MATQIGPDRLNHSAPSSAEEHPRPLGAFQVPEEMLAMRVVQFYKKILCASHDSGHLIGCAGLRHV